MLDWQPCQICYPLEIKLLLLYKAQGSISLCGQVLDMCIPIKIMTDFQS